MISHDVFQQWGWDRINSTGLLHGGNKISTSNLLVRATAKLYMQKLVQNRSLRCTDASAEK